MHDETGGLLLSFSAHSGRANLAATLGITTLLTSGDDGRVVVNDLVRGAVNGVIDVGTPVVWIGIDPTEHFAAFETLDRRVVVADLQNLELSRTHRTPTWARWSGITSTLACADGATVWVEAW